MLRANMLGVLHAKSMLFATCKEHVAQVKVKVTDGCIYNREFRIRTNFPILKW